MKKNVIYRLYYQLHSNPVDLGMYSTFEKAQEGLFRDIIENYHDSQLMSGKWGIDFWDIDAGWNGQNPVMYMVYQNHPQYNQTPKYIYEHYKDKEWS
jgi:hypothetical protein